jgi:hypothetical protein
MAFDCLSWNSSRSFCSALYWWRFTRRGLNHRACRTGRAVTIHRNACSAMNRLIRYVCSIEQSSSKRVGMPTCANRRSVGDRGKGRQGLRHPPAVETECQRLSICFLPEARCRRRRRPPAGECRRETSCRYSYLSAYPPVAFGSPSLVLSLLRERSDQSWTGMDNSFEDRFPTCRSACK